MAGICGGAEPISGWAITPCYLETFGVGLGAAFVLAMLLQWRRIARVAELRHLGQKLTKLSGISGGEAGFAIGAGFLMALHAMHAALAVYLHLPLWHLSLHVLLQVVWSLIAGLTIWTSKVHGVLDFRLFSATVLLLYFAELESYWTLYRSLTDTFPLAYVRATIWTLLLQTVVTAILIYADTQRAKSPQAKATAGPVREGYEQLPNGDVEAGPSHAAAQNGAADGQKRAAGEGAGGGKEQEQEGHSWLSLFWEACVYVWPEDRMLQIRALLSLLLLLSMRVLNVAVPVMYKHMVDALSKATDGSSTLIWGWLSPFVLLYLGAIFFQGGAGGGMIGFVNNLRQFLYIPVAQDAYRRISLRIFKHVMGLDLSFHLGRKTGEVTKQIDRGTNAMQNILSTILFSILPTCIDVLTASTYLAQALEPSIAITVFITVGSYIPVTIIITEWRGALRREMNRTDQAQSARVTDALLNYETVKYFTNEQYEYDQYSNAIGEYQSAEFKSMASVNLLNTVQSLIMWIGISVGLCVCSYGVHQGELTVGDVVLFLSLMAQLYAPLNWFGSYYRTIQQYMIDMENLFNLLDKQSGVQDKPGAKDLVVARGEVAFEDVTFGYEPSAPVLKNVSWRVDGGKTIAFVGATGSGKSTITRLVFRFYEATSGRVTIDGLDVRDVTQASLRRAIGMVPQDTVLFNDTILHNIRYGHIPASDEDVHKAADLACIHEAVTTRFPKGYETMVGERGLRLSGGEKQRVAFARALLKNPPILVLDEATSALDTLTERKVQGALANLRSSRTTLVVAHRLSTIVDAHTIVVMHHGEVREMGSHVELLARQGLYAEMWAKQGSGATEVTEGDTPTHGQADSSSGTASGADASMSAAGAGEGSSAGGQGAGRGRGRGRGGEGRGGAARGTSVDSHHHFHH